MPELRVGKAVIPYDLERKDDITRRYVRVTPDQVLVTVPSNDSQKDIDGFLRRKERWIYDNTQRIAFLKADSSVAHRYISGVKVLYRGRRVRLTVARTSEDQVSVTYKNGFIVELPDFVTDGIQDHVIESELRLWMKSQVRKDVMAIVSAYRKRSGLKPTAVRVKDQKHMWGSCGKDGSININWQLVYAPKPVLEYAVWHEMCHLAHRSHDKAFWVYLKKYMPDYEVRKAWLEENEVKFVESL